MKSRIVKILFIVFIVAIIILSIKKLLLDKQSKEIERLFTQSGNISDRKFYSRSLKGLPKPVQRYFKNVLKEGQPYISYIRLTHGGYFKTGSGKDWVKIQGEQYFTAENPGFLWKGKTTLFTAIDKYIKNEGALTVRLLSIFRIVNSRGEKINQGELLRWLGESVWFPTNLLPSEKLQWLPIDDSSAKLIYRHNDMEVFYIVTFNEKDEITQMETERYMNENFESWVGTLKNYKEINGILIPTEIEALWKLDKGDYPYANFKINEIDYENPVEF